MKKVIVLIVLAFAVTLAVIVGYRMSTEAMAVVVGAVVGVLAGIPMAFLVLMATRRTQSSYSYQSEPPQAPYPPVVVIQGGQATPLQAPTLGPGAMAAEVEPRTYRVLGHEED